MEYLRKRRRGFLATTGGNGVTLVPVCYVNLGAMIYTAIDTKPKGKSLARLTNISSNRRVAFIVDNYSEDWRALSYLLIHGNAQLVGDEEEASMARSLLTRKYPQYKKLKLGLAPVICIRIKRSKFWSFEKRQSRGIASNP
jgi:PPOX class probable F420-dependent enzyme